MLPTCARLERTERRARELPHREKYLLLVVGFLRGFLDLHDELIDDVERAARTRT
jgi:hypothetical protein